MCFNPRNSFHEVMSYSPIQLVLGTLVCASGRPLLAIIRLSQVFTLRPPMDSPLLLCKLSSMLLGSLRIVGHKPVRRFVQRGDYPEILA